MLSLEYSRNKNCFRNQTARSLNLLSIVVIHNTWKEVTVMLTLFVRRPHYAKEICKRRFHQ